MSVIPDLRSPLPPPPPETFGQRLRRQLRFYGLILFIIVLWAGSSLFIAPVVQWGLDRVGGAIEKVGALRHKASLLDVKLDMPCTAFETMPPQCGADEGEVRYGPISVLYFWGRLPGLDGLSIRERQDGIAPNADTDGAFYTLQKSFGNLPEGDAALALARTEMAAYGAYAERQIAPDVLAIEAAEGSAAKLGSFYAVYTASDGRRIAAACFGGTCKVPQANWRDGLAYGLTINARNAARLPQADAAVRARLDGFLVR
ncbi:MAG: hypothetical protein QM698_14010 [Micropepsaceae bacterium]